MGSFAYDESFALPAFPSTIIDDDDVHKSGFNVEIHSGYSVTNFWIILNSLHFVVSGFYYFQPTLNGIFDKKNVFVTKPPKTAKNFFHKPHYIECRYPVLLQQFEICYNSLILPTVPT